MTYATSNPPQLVARGIGAGAPARWVYVSTDATATVDGAGYITNGGALGMRVNDTVEVTDTTNSIVTYHRVVTVSATSPGVVDLSNGTTIGSSSNSD